MVEACASSSDIGSPASLGGGGYARIVTRLDRGGPAVGVGVGVGSPPERAREGRAGGGRIVR